MTDRSKTMRANIPSNTSYPTRGLAKKTAQIKPMHPKIKEISKNAQYGLSAEFAETTPNNNRIANNPKIDL
ncbi:hypothetical protein [Diaphorobacter aerolatus]|uniref:Uncharacterized protein n=1 Tax=Diaphorobacter aerolatus TaxID=1288495 RepID=A0A7H0GGS2_9BURK|nr:hypothetical protein [Diaphorobacter aerolatus]QNP47488.1 hypothetical protein H9K75_14565 [Diaphorobacter aerolatus]